MRTFKEFLETKNYFDTINQHKIKEYENYFISQKFSNPELLAYAVEEFLRYSGSESNPIQSYKDLFDLATQHSVDFKDLKRAILIIDKSALAYLYRQAMNNNENIPKNKPKNNWNDEENDERYYK